MPFRLFSRRNNPPRQRQKQRNFFADVRTRILVWYFVLATCITLGSIWATYKIFCAQEQQLAGDRLNRDITAFQSLVEERYFSFNPSAESLSKLLEQFIVSQVRDPNEYLFIVFNGQLYHPKQKPLPLVLQNNPNKIEVEDTITALNGGANDYVTKPFDFEVLLARVRVQLRDRTPIKTRTAKATTLTIGNIVLDLLTRQVWVENQLVEMSVKEFQMAEVFLRHPMQVLSREQLLTRVWGYDYDPGSNIVDVYVGALTQKARQ